MKRESYPMTYRKHPVLGWQFWSTYDLAWQDSAHNDVGTAPGLRYPRVSYVTTWAEPVATV